MLPAALTVIILMVALVSGGIWAVQSIASLRKDVSDLAAEIGHLKRTVGK